MSNTSDTKLTHLRNYEVILVLENTTEENVREIDNTLPTDIHVITYKDGEETKYDAARANRMTDIFDGYYDLGVTVTSIKSGYGKIKPKLYNPDKKEKK